MSQSERRKAQRISIRRVIPGRRWKILRMLTQIDKFSDHMPHVKSAHVVEKTPHKTISDWYVETDGLPIRWKQEDTFDRTSFTLHFKAVEGDLAVLEGSWKLTKLDAETTEVILQVQAALGIPVIDTVVYDVLASILRKNFEQMLNAIEDSMIDKRYIRTGERVIKEDVKGFVVMGHPYNYNHLIRIFKVFQPDVVNINKEFLLKIFELAPSYKSSDIKNFTSANGTTVDGHFVMCPIIPDMALLTPELVLPKVLDGCRIGERLGAGVLALGGFTSIVGEKYFDRLKKQIKIPITTGNAFTSAMTLAGIRKAAQILGINYKTSKATVIGGTGDIGSACARVLATQVSELVITGRSEKSLQAMEEQLKKIGGAKITTTRDNNEAVKSADIVIAAASSATSLVNIDNIKPGAVVCDVGYPKNISYRAKRREDILVFSGGLTSLPTPFNLGFDVGLPSPNILYGCFAEAIILSLEKRYENFSEGKGKIMPEKIELIEKMASKHGFGPAPFYSGDELIDDKDVELIYTRAKVA